MSFSFGSRFLGGRHSGPTRGMSWPEFYRQQQQECRHPALKAFYGAGLPTGDTPLCKVPLVAMDFETTGLDSESCDIVSIGLVPMTLERIYNSQSTHWIVRPRSELSGDSVVFHGITHSAIDQAPDLCLVLDQLLQHLQGRVVIAHCCHIERSFLDKAVRARWGEGIHFPMLDTMALENSLIQRDLIDRLFGTKPKSIRLADCRQRYNLPFYHPHHAETDALACAELFQAQISTHFSPYTAISQLWC
mgnify:CR=1 FL=1